MSLSIPEYPLLAMVALLAVGCAAGDPAATASSSGESGGESAVASSADRTEGTPAPTAGNAAQDRGVGLQPVDYAGLLTFVEGQAGRPLVLDVWSTSCEPCVRELPNLAKLSDEYRERGVVCATLNIDYTGAVDTTPDDAKTVAEPVLEALGIHVQNLYSTTPDRELFKQELFKENRLYAPPAIFVFDRAGKVVAAIGEADEGASPYDKVRSALEPLLESPPAQPDG